MDGEILARREDVIRVLGVEGRATGDLTTIEDPSALQQLQEAAAEQRG